MMLSLMELTDFAFMKKLFLLKHVHFTEVEIKASGVPSVTSTEGSIDYT